MKKLITIIAIAFLLIGCEKESNGCQCTKEYYNIDTYIVFDDNGIPHTTINHILLYSEGVECQDEVNQQSTGGYEYFNIVCE